MLMLCTACDKPILDKYVLTVLDQPWHPACVRCATCGLSLNEKCFARDNKLFCREDFYKKFGPKCDGCGLGLSPLDLVRKAKDRVFHLKCFTCTICRKQLLTGEELYVVNDDKFVCKQDYLQRNDVGYDEDELDEDEDEDGYMEPRKLELGSPTSNLNKTPSLIDSSTERDLNDSEGSMNGDVDGDDEKGYKEDGSGAKRRGPRTTIKAKQLEVLKTAFNQTPKPTRHIREQLAKETGLPMRVIQVWFQNKRSKERRMKQLAGRGGGFFVGGKRIRGFGLGPPGMDDGRFFYDGMGPDYGRYPTDFFPGGPGFPGGPNLSFNNMGPGMEQPLPMNIPTLPPLIGEFNQGPPPRDTFNHLTPFSRGEGPLTRPPSSTTPESLRSPRPGSRPGSHAALSNQNIEEGIGVW